MRRFVPLLIAAVALVAAACADSTAPVARAGESTLSTAHASSAAKEPRRSNVVQEFVIPADGGTVQLGEFTLTFPANAVCDRGSHYGTKYWDEPCKKTLKEDVQITAMMWSEKGESLIKLSPDVRFSPDVEVIISTYREELKGATSLGDFWMYSWTRGEKLGGRRKFNDAANDPSLATHFDPATGLVWRRLKHFSGISINSGRSEE